ncbi:SDR family oxidoreductase [Alkalicoccobacillus murimartini]|uniref:3-oxoacyl-[acyl-carrier protein] reductase n=1 Tax=Alkalicoccobacillus murimartini TaxID=171685 RepID=A0ABT9YG73_9BACI|nr:SDR family oxidoreductase [Alkalicoccobacillus murimartini]MDQ0206860.1 3-oxoacyl-[acyl-carrier protein] reductase [Alkalicoccobacillus murimartini]
MEKPLAIVTGVSRSQGIGAAICRELAASGVDVLFTYWSPYEQLSGLAEVEDSTLPLKQELQNQGILCERIELDLSVPSSSHRLFDLASKRFNRHANVLVNNAAVSMNDNIQSITAERLDLHYKINIRATTLLTAEFVKRFTGVNGRIINITTGWSRGQMPEELSYVLTKSSIDTLTYTLASSLAKKQITINSVNPGPTDSGWMNQQVKDTLLPRFPAGRIGQPRDAAKLITFLASPDAEWITGQIIHSEGGFLNADE